MTPLETLIRQHIEAAGPMSVAEYMSLCLGHPEHGYYMGRDPFGREGDFITSPEISQMFGELLGLWSVATWQALGNPADFALIEFGPGRGTLMADALRAASGSKPFLSGASVHMVEMSPALIEQQKKTLADAGVRPQWHLTFEDVLTNSKGPLIILANEFLDALPVHQFVRIDGVWHERAVGIEDGALTYTHSTTPADPEVTDYCDKLSSDDGAVVEISPAAAQVISDISLALNARGGAALFIDYGYEVSAAGETLQAVKSHDYVSVFETPGEADLTAHVNFGAVAGAAIRAGCEVHGPLAQGDFLGRIGIHQRAQKLAEANPDHREPLAAAHARLTLPNQMGSLFKVIAVTPKGFVPPAFAVAEGP